MPDQEPVLEPLLLDHKVVGQTMLSKFAKCPRDAYLYRKHPKQTHPMMRGIVFHGGAEALINYMVEAGEPQANGEVARDFIEGYLSDHPEYALPESERDALRLMGWNLGESLVLDLENLVGNEVPVTFEIDGWLLRCRIDLVFAYPDHIKVWDWKTSLAMMKDEEAQRNFQSSFYSLAVLEGSPNGSPVPLGAGLNDVDFSFVYPRYRDKEHGYLKTRGAAFDRKDLQDFKATLSDLITKLERAYETQEWPAFDGSHCSLCTAQELCPIKPEIRELPELTNETEARELASELYAVERFATRAKKGLKGWVSENGPLYFGEDLAMDITATESQSIRDKDALKVGIRHAVEFGEPFDLDDHFQTKHGTRFSKRKLKPEEMGDA